MREGSTETLRNEEYFLSLADVAGMNEVSIFWYRSRFYLRTRSACLLHRDGE